jgi:hypothetical protein
MPRLAHVANGSKLDSHARRCVEAFAAVEVAGEYTGRMSLGGRIR